VLEAGAGLQPVTTGRLWGTHGRRSFAPDHRVCRRVERQSGAQTAPRGVVW